jgi:MFS-type transporter involved in bile tolerance (Atg22 family)
VSEATTLFVQTAKFQSRFGFHNEWEFWLYQVIYGIFVCQWYAYSVTMISEVTPRGKEFLFFSLFSVMGKASAFVSRDPLQNN